MAAQTGHAYAVSVSAQRDSVDCVPAGKAVAQSERRVQAARSVLEEHRASHGPTSDLERTIGLAMLRLLPPELQRLQLMVTAPDLALALSVKERVREMFGPGNGRALSGE